jgi:hypothetical protein
MEPPALAGGSGVVAANPRRADATARGIPANVLEERRRPEAPHAG